MTNDKRNGKNPLPMFIDEIHALSAQRMTAIRAERNAHEQQRQIAELRDNLSYRLASVQWHVDYLQKLLDHLEEQYLPSHVAEGESTSFLLRAVHQAYFVFDDIVFNLVSCFDYLARLVGYLALGQEGFKLKWGPLTNCARARKAGLKKNGLAPLIEQWDRDFVDSLQKYRGDLIHRERRMGAVEGAFEFTPEQLRAAVRVSVPAELAKPLTGRASFKNAEPAEVLAGARILVERSVRCGSELFRAAVGASNTSVEPTA